jgi:hypothetical protein
MHHIDFEIDCLPQNRVSSMLRAAAARSKISDPRVPQHLGPQLVLDFWSKQIHSDFQNQLNMSKIESCFLNEPASNQQHQFCNMLLDLTKKVGKSKEGNS